jgi:hypothetical protein
VKKSANNTHHHHHHHHHPHPFIKFTLSFVKKHQQTTPTITTTTTIPTHSSKSHLVLWRKSANKFISANKKVLPNLLMNQLQQNPNSHYVVPSQQKRTKTAKKFTQKDFLQIHTSSV